MESHQLLHFILFSTLIVFPFRVFSSSSINSLASTNCRSSCGHLDNVTYPFRFHGDPSTCGDIDYEINCTDDSPFVTILSTTYYVMHISYSTSTVRLLDSRLSITKCVIPIGSPSSEELGSQPQYMGRVSDTETSFFGCSKGTNLSSEVYRRFPCLDGIDYDAYVGYGVYILSSLQGSCKFITRVPTIYQPVLYPSYDSIVQLLEAGFDLGWTIECRNCVVSGGSCLKAFNGPSEYRCSNDAHLTGQVSFAPMFVLLFLFHKFIIDHGVLI